MLSMFIAGLVLGATLGYHRGVERRPQTRLDTISLEAYRRRMAERGRRS